jgi:hypothetical protein
MVMIWTVEVFYMVNTYQYYDLRRKIKEIALANLKAITR